MPPVKAKPKKKTRAAKKSPKKAKRAVVAKRKAVTKPRRKAVAKPKRKAAPKPKRKAVAKPKRKAVAKTRHTLAPKTKRSAVLSPAKPKPAAPATPRRDATGHLSAEYASGLRAMSKESAEPKDAASFVHGSKSLDPLAEERGEDFVKTALSGEDSTDDTLDQVVPEERGGPFIETTAGTEFADGTDASNPKGSKPEPFPTT
jgi:hypothetical protein